MWPSEQVIQYIKTACAKVGIDPREVCIKKYRSAFVVYLAPSACYIDRDDLADKVIVSFIWPIQWKYNITIVRMETIREFQAISNYANCIDLNKL